jgi:sugar lactone lactonase YvrE
VRDSEIEVLVEGRGLVEGPRWDERDGSVWFTDALAGGVFRWVDGEVETVDPARRGVGGLVLHEDGGVVASGRDLVHLTADGDTRQLLALDGVTGFNDIEADLEGGVLAGALRYHPLKGEDPVAGEVWRLRADDGGAEELFGGVVWANGIGLSPDGATVYVSDYQRECVLAWSGGTETRAVHTAVPGSSCDGLAVDEEGHVWVATGAGGCVARFDPQGSPSGVLTVPADFVSSVAFGGEDMHDLYIATIGALYRTHVPVAGSPTYRARV